MFVQDYKLPKKLAEKPYDNEITSSDYSVRSNEHMSKINIRLVLKEIHNVPGKQNKLTPTVNSS